MTCAPGGRAFAHRVGLEAVGLGALSHLGLAEMSMLGRSSRPLGAAAQCAED